MAKAFAWSYSTLNGFETCPKQHYLTKVSKQVPFTDNAANIWGKDVHKALELRITKGTPLPANMSMFEPQALAVAQRAEGKKLDAERQMALTIDYKPTGWFSHDVWVRGITDFTIEHNTTAFVGDWKSGKPTPESAQLRLTAVMTMHERPHIEKVINAFIWLKGGKPTTEIVTRADIPTIWKEFHPRVERMRIATEENKFPAKPSGLCKQWCPVGKALCDHCGV